MAPLSALFFTTALGGGGAESHLARLLNALDRRRVMPVLAVARGGGSYEADLPRDVERFVLGPDLRSSTGRVLASVPALRALVTRRRFDVLVPILDAPVVAATLALTGLSRAPRLVPSVQAPPRMLYDRSRLATATVLPLLARCYRRADAVIALSHGVADELRPWMGARDTLRVVYNACTDESLLARGTLPLDEPEPPEPWLVACGRLAEQKDYPTLLRAFALVRRRHPATLVILGEGPDAAALAALARTLGVESSVRFLGFRRAPERYMARATAFVLSSRFEGFGNVVAEALAVGAPVVATDCPHGPSEILAGGSYGLLVPPRDPAALAEALGRVLEDSALRARLRADAPARGAAFSSRAAAEGYTAVMEEIAR